LNPLIVALDVPDLDQAVGLARNLQGEVGHFKVGLELFGSHGPEAVKRIAEFGPVFLDLKLHDIPTTVERAARTLGRHGVSMLTIHALGGPAMVAAAVEGLADGAKGQGGPTPMVLAVTILTSMRDSLHWQPWPRQRALRAWSARPRTCRRSGRSWPKA
jgi:orotidine-5'-phosphate decarboxylase